MAMADGREIMTETLSPKNATAADGRVWLGHYPYVPRLPGSEWGDESCCGVVEKENNVFFNDACMDCYTPSGPGYPSLTDFLFLYVGGVLRRAYYKHHLSGRNHHALYDAQQTALMMRPAVPRLMQTPTSRGATTMRSTMHSKQR
ncbi:hypothetical protein E8E15_010304 [Penicillium rubens]|nr:hypothetical protein E8E15_010304 [Penicillium rubens]